MQLARNMYTASMSVVPAMTVAAVLVNIQTVQR